MRLWAAIALLSACPQAVVIDDRDALPRSDAAPLADAGPRPIAWKVFDVQLTDRFNAIHGTSAEDVWVVGARGLVLHYDGSRWERQQAGVLDELRAVHAISRDEVWIAGDNGALSSRTNRSWSSHRTVAPTASGGEPADLVSIAATSTDDLWIVPSGIVDVGGVTSEHAALHRKLGQWTLVERPDPGSYEVVMRLRGASGIILHDGDLQHRVGDEWLNVEPPVRESLLSFVDAQLDDRDRVWVIGDQITPSRARSFRRTGSSWEELDGPALTNSLLSTELTAIWVSGDEAWAVGEFAQLAHFDGQSWNNLIPGTLGAPKLRAIFVADGKIFAAGAQGALYCAGCD